MKQRAGALLLLLSVLVTRPLLAQKPVLETYQVKVVTKMGDHFRGVFADITPTTLYYDPGTRYSPNHYLQEIPLVTIRKVTLRRTSKRRAIRAGVVVGALGFGFLAVDGLKNNPASSSATYGITVLFAAGAGAAVGLVVGSTIGNVSHRVVRPGNLENGLGDLYRQLEPFSMRYQNDVLNRIHY